MPFNPAGILDDPAPYARRLLQHTSRVRRAILEQRRGKLFVLRARLLAPVRAVRDSVRILRDRGKEGAVSRNAALPMQILATCWLHTRHDYNVDAALRFELFQWRDMHPVPLFLPEEDLALIACTIIPRIDSDGAALLADKRRFAGWTMQHDIPSPLILMQFENGTIERGSLDDPQLRQDLFAKWATSYGGAKRRHGASGTVTTPIQRASPVRSNRW